MRQLLFFPLFLLTTAAYGQDSPADRISPYLTEDAVAVGRLDLKALNVDAAFDRLPAVLFPDRSDADAVREAAKNAVESLRKAGAAEMFLVVSATDIPNAAPYFIVPRSGQGDGTDLVELLKSPQPPGGLGDIVKALDGAVFVGPQRSLDRLKARQTPAERPALADAFAAVDGPIQVVLTFSEDHRRVLREMLPDLPPDFGGATGDQLAAGLQWAAIGIGFEPKLAAKVVIQGESEQAAEALLKAITAGLRRLSTTPEVIVAFPAMPLFVRALTPKQEGARLVLVADETLDAVTKLLRDAAGTARMAAGQNQSMNNLKQMGLAFHNFYDVYQSLPPNASYDGDKPLLSWRVYLLPFLGEAPLYAEFHLDEPWDSEHNKTLIERMPDVFKSPAVPTPAGQTVYLVPTGEGLAFGGKTGTTFAEVTDGTSNTILVVEATAEKAVPWTKPDDLSIDPKNPLLGLIDGREKFNVLFCDGSARAISVTIDPATFLKLLTPAGGEVVDFSQF